MNDAIADIRVLVVDDHPLIRLGLRQIFDSTPGINIAAEATTGVEALRVLERLEVDIVILDMAMPGRSGVEILKRIGLAQDAPPVLIYSRFPEDQYAIRALRAGAAGYLMKSAPPDDLIAAVHRLAAGEHYLSARVARLMETEPRRARPHDELSNREFEIMRMLTSGHSVSRIAGELSLSVKTVSTHRTRILRKLALSSTADLVHYAIDHGLDDTQT